MLHRSVIAGSWYPSDKTALRLSILDYLSEAQIREDHVRPLAIISPHAGHIYSGLVAAHAYKSLNCQDYRNVVIICPSHRMHFPFVAAWGEGAFETPLGQIEVDTEACRRLAGLSPLVVDETKPHIQEHALEIQLPFLQVILPEFKLVPLIMGEQRPELCRELAHALKAAYPDPAEVLVIASSDLSHFHPRQTAKRMDERLAEHLANFDIVSLAQELESGAIEACGGGPIMAAMHYAELNGCRKLEVLCQADSSNVSGDETSVVGYLAARLA